MSRHAPWVLRALFAASLGVGLSSLGGVAEAQPTHEPPPEALEFFASGRAHYEAGRYTEAAQDLEAALTLDPGSPTLIYNLSRVYELMGEMDRAIRYMEQYLQLTSPDDQEERESAETALRRLRGARDWLALREAAQQGQAQSLRQLAPRVIVRERGVADLPFWITLGAGAGILAVGGVTGGLTFGAKNEVEDFTLRLPQDQNRRESLVDRRQRLALATDVLLGVGAATCVGALLLYLLRTRSFERDAEPEETNASRRSVETEWALGATDTSGWLAWRGRW